MNGNLAIQWLVLIFLIWSNGIDGNLRNGCSQYKRPLTGNIDNSRQGFFNCWGVDVESGQSELVILIDTSGSMWEYGVFQGSSQSGYEIAKSFVKALLSEVRVAFNATRVAVGTFSRQHRIDFNYILDPTYTNTKCKFMDDFKKLKFDGELTNTKGALSDAYNIFRQLDSYPERHLKRKRSNKVVVLLTDGYGNMVGNRFDGVNGRDATPEATRLKQIGYVEVYTIGVTNNIDKDMLEKIATDKSLFLQASSFTDLGNLAFNIRGDPYEKDYETFQVNPNLCGDCDPNALCGCNLKSGDYRCVCKRGYYGTGERLNAGKSCFECPKNTYGDRRGYLTDCPKCPENSETRYIPGKPALSLRDCYCKDGYTGSPKDGYPCKPKSCKPPPDINFASIVNKNECGKQVFGTKCFYQCKPNYKMVTSRDYTQCNSGGVWDFPYPKCELISCKASWDLLDASKKFSVQCNSTVLDQTDQTYVASTKCDFNCKNQYYAHSGSSSIQCLPSGQWNSASLDCRVSECPIIPKLHKVITVLNPNFNCFENVLKVGDQCKFYCPSGYSLRGRGVFECLNSNSRIGKWNVDTSVTANIPTCVDIQKPEFTDSYRCDTGISIVKETLKGKNYAKIDFEIINATDNSGEPVEVTCWTGDKECPYEMGKTYEIEVTKSIDVKFKATDTSGNARACLFQISVLDKEKPTITYCPDNIMEKTSDLSKQVTWKEVEFTDNCGVYPECDIQSTSNIASGSVFVRNVPTTVSYIIRDPSNNINEDCKFDVKVEAMGCSRPEPPRNGIVVVNANLAQAYCSQGNYPNALMSNLYICINGMWMAPGGMGVFPFPDCIEKNPPNGMSQQMILLLQFDGDCSSNAIQEQVKTRFKTYTGIGEGLDKIDLYCGSSSLVSRRRRRTIKQLSMKVTILTKVSKEEASKDPYNVLNILRSKMDSVISPQFMSDMKKFRKWRSLNKYLASLYRVNKIGSTKEQCGEVGDMENDAEPELNKRCVVCGAGEFKNVLTGKCEKCPPGQYQPNPGQTECLRCPEGTVIIGGDTKNYTSCKTTCKPGEYSPNGLAPCYKCPTGSYSDKVMSKACRKCPVGTVTLSTGGASLYDCGTACQRGTYSSNGVEPCAQCPKGYFQSKYGSQKCNACPDLKSTAGKGSISIGSCVNIDDCSSNPCMNQGHCIDLKDNYRCECKAGYWGKNCELEVDECRFRPCINNGTCLDKFQSYKCMCRTGTAGQNCDQVVSKCKQNTCSHHGKCIDAADQKFKCICNAFYTGEFCETKIDPCYPNPCGNEGVCVREWNSQSFQCQCKTGFSGETCKVKLNNCGSNPCKNGATCIDQKTGFSCICEPGYNGPQCQTLIDMCSHKKCHNGGECVPLVNDVKCKCAPGFSGKQCDQVESSNFDISLQSRVSPSFASIHGRKDLPRFTLAFWMRTSDNENIGTPISYAVMKNGKLDDNALVLTDYSNFNLLINNETQSLEFDGNDGEWHHIAVKWNNNNGFWTAYKDGIQIRRAKSPMQKGKVIPRGGIFVIGEEQDGYGNNFTPSESFIGDMSQLNIWDRELSANEIYDLAMSCNHESGNVVAWADFGAHKTGSVISTSPSLACDFNSVLRDFQYFENSNLPTQLLNRMPKLSYPRIASASLCAKECLNRLEWCRSFTFTKYSNTATCQMFSTSSLIAGVQPVKKFGTDLYLLSCVRPLGMASSGISDSQVTASSTKGNAHPWLARLYLTPNGNEKIKFWQPRDGVKSYIQVELGRVTKVTSIATQGHFDKSVKEFATSFRIKYKASGTWKWYNQAQVISANTAPAETIRRELHLVGTAVQIHVEHDSRSSRIAFRFELYGCPMKPQGTPDTKSDSDQCASSPCLNGGTCYDLYKRYKCVCPYGYNGDRCQNTVVCQERDLDAPVNGKVLLVRSTGMYFCNPGFKFKYKVVKAAECHSGNWINAQQQNCEDIDECALNLCSDGCENTIGSFRCTCPRGKYLSGDGRKCLDMNECARRIDGCVNGCENTDGGYRCLCKKGFYSPGERMCHDFNECESKSNNCEQLCENTLGSFRCKCKPGYALNKDGRTCQFIRCPIFRNIQHGSVNVVGDKATYSCSDGWKIDGLKERYCLADGTLSGVEPKCVPVKCVPLLGPENGYITRRTGSNYNDLVYFACNPGYMLIGSLRRVCSSNSEWDGVEPMCVIQVCQRFNVVNGKLLGFGAVVGSVVRVQCNKGFQLRQKSMEFLKCESDGRWTGGIRTLSCDPIFCGAVESKNHVSVSYVNGQGYNALARYSCSPGQCLEGNKVRRCQANGKWSGEAPVCKKNSCCKPFVPDEAKLYSDNIYGKNSAAFIKCNEGYTTGGDEFRECSGMTYKWSGEDTSCKIVDCGDPGTPANGKRHIQKTTYLSTISFFCMPQYLMSGSSERTCQANGEWSGVQPKCRLGDNGGHIAAKSGNLKCLGHEKCHWLIEVTQGAKVTISVKELNLTDGEQMKVYDGQSWEPFVVFTNRSRPLPVTSNTHFMRIITSGHIAFTFSQSKCGGMLSAEHGVITSPNYPNHYPPNLDCYWTIHRPYNRLELRFTDFLIQRRSVDYVTVREGPFETSDYLLYNYFLDKIPWLTKDWADRWYWIHFHSDVKYANRGFQALFSNYQPRV